MDIAKPRAAKLGQLETSLATAMVGCSHLEFNVTVAYWSMIWLFPTLLNTDSFDVSLLLDIKIHLLPYVFLTTDSTWHRYGVRRSTIIMAQVVLGVYWLAIETHMASNNGTASFPYPFLQGASIVKRFGLILLFASLASVDYSVKKLLSFGFRYHPRVEVASNQEKRKAH